MSQGMSSPDPQMRKAGCALLGVIAEGCCDSIREQLPTIMPALLSAVQDPEYYVREVGCFALGEIILRMIAQINATAIGSQSFSIFKP